MEVQVPMKEVYCRSCTLPFLFPFKLVEFRSYREAIFCPGCGKDYRTTYGVPEIQDLKSTIRSLRSEKETLARSNAAFRGILKKSGCYGKR